MYIHIVSKSSSHTLEWRRTCSDQIILSFDRLEEVKNNGKFYNRHPEKSPRLPVREVLVCLSFQR